MWISIMNGKLHTYMMCIFTFKNLLSWLKESFISTYCKFSEFSQKNWHVHLVSHALIAHCSPITMASSIIFMLAFFFVWQFIVTFFLPFLYPCPFSKCSKHATVECTPYMKLFHMHVYWLHYNHGKSFLIFILQCSSPIID